LFTIADDLPQIRGEASVSGKQKLTRRCPPPWSIELLAEYSIVRYGKLHGLNLIYINNRTAELAACVAVNRQVGRHTEPALHEISVGAGAQAMEDKR
jgi:hypothetical protein